MRDRVAWKALKTALLIMIVVAAIAVLASCHPHGEQIEEREPIVINGGIQCQLANGGKILCAVHLEEQVDE